jgi:hypothetical protein
LQAEQVILPAKQIILPAEQVILPAKQVILPAEQVILPAKQVILQAEQIILPAKQVLNTMPQRGKRSIRMSGIDWMPGTRSGILVMAKDQSSYTTTERRTAWNIPSDRFLDYGTAFGTAQAAQAKVGNTAERNHVDTVVCNEAFDSLKGIMRFFKNHYYLMPPLTKIDWAELGFRDQDDRPSTAPASTDVPMATPSYPGAPHLILVTLGALLGTRPLDRRSDYGYALYVGVMPQGGATLEQAASVKHYLMAPPLDGEGLKHYLFTRRQKELTVFAAAESGMTAYFCARYENQKGWKGSWGPVSSAIIP